MLTNTCPIKKSDYASPCSEYTPVELKRHKKQENDQWRLLMVEQWGSDYWTNP